MKKLSQSDLNKVIANLENGLVRITDRAKKEDSYAHSVALGMSESVIEHAIKQLKGEYPII